jgi:hypothetical protein
MEYHRECNVVSANPKIAGFRKQLTSHRITGGAGEGASPIIGDIVGLPSL